MRRWRTPWLGSSVSVSVKRWRTPNWASVRFIHEASVAVNTGVMQRRAKARRKHG